MQKGAHGMENMDRLMDYQVGTKLYMVHRNNEGYLELYRNGRQGLERIVTLATDHAELDQYFPKKPKRIKHDAGQMDLYDAIKQAGG